MFLLRMCTNTICAVLYLLSLKLSFTICLMLSEGYSNLMGAHPQKGVGLGESIKYSLY